MQICTQTGNIMGVDNHTQLTLDAHEFYYEDDVGNHTPINIEEQILKYAPHSLSQVEFLSVLEIAIWHNYRRGRGVGKEIDDIDGYDDVISCSIDISEEYYQTVYTLVDEILLEKCGYIPYFIGWIGYIGVFSVAL